MPQGVNETVAAMIAPALFLTATGSLLISTSNRIARIVDRIRALVTLLYMAFTAFAGTSLVIGLKSAMGSFLDALPPVFAVTGVALLFVACIYLVLEARSSLKGNDRELQFFDELERLRAEARSNAEPAISAAGTPKNMPTA
jgi:hypothetical protein